MIGSNEIQKIKETTQEVLQKMTITGFNIEAKTFFLKEELEPQSQDGLKEGQENKDIVDLDIEMQDPQFLIGQSGQTLFGLERILKIILNKKLQKSFYLKLDINDYKKKKIEYLRSLARDSGNEVFLTKKEKILPPMPSYERRVIHMELAQNQDITTKSQGDGENRCVVISPRTK